MLRMQDLPIAEHVYTFVDHAGEPTHIAAGSLAIMDWPRTVRPTRKWVCEPYQPRLPGFKAPCPWCGKYDCEDIRR